MAKVSFETISFQEKGQDLQVTLLSKFYSLISKKEISQNLGEVKLIDAHTLEFPKVKQSKAELEFSQLLADSFDNLKNKLNGNKVTYIHRNSGIPLIGNVAFGIVYRDSSIIEIKPITSCNLNCIYCSVGEGLDSKKQDFVVEKDYMVEELNKLLKFISEPVEIHVGVQGEPFLYTDMLPLVEDLQALELVKTISIDTNGTLLNKELIDKLAKNDKLRLNFSLDAMEEKLAKELAGVESYNVKHVLEIIKYASGKMNILIAPLVVPGYNEKEMEKVIEFAKTLPKLPVIGIQKFLPYKTGRNPLKKNVKIVQWSEFYAWIDKLEKKYDVKLKICKEDFLIKPTRALPKPFSVDDKVAANLVAEDRFPNTCIAAAKGRNISVPECLFRAGKRVKLRILRDKHNVFVGKLCD